MLDDALEVATEIADVVLAAVGAWCGHIEGAMRTALIAMVVAGIAVDEAVGHHEVHRLGGERLQGAVVVLGCRRRHRHACVHRQRYIHRTAHHCPPEATGTRTTHTPAINRLSPPMANA